MPGISSTGRACGRCGSLLHHEDDCPSTAPASPTGEATTLDFTCSMCKEPHGDVTCLAYLIPALHDARAEIQREREERSLWASSASHAELARLEATARAEAAEQRLREVEGEYSKLAKHSASMRSERDSALSELAALRGALTEIQSATRHVGYGPGWTAFRIASHALSPSTAEPASGAGAGNADGGEGKGG